jgi:hypothetical protein
VAEPRRSPGRGVEELRHSHPTFFVGEPAPAAANARCESNNVELGWGGWWLRLGEAPAVASKNSATATRRPHACGLN